MKFCKIFSALMILLLGGCMSFSKAPWVVASTAPIPPEGYTVMGSVVTGTYPAGWGILFIPCGGAALDDYEAKPPMQCALQEALKKAGDADALIGATCEYHIKKWPFYLYWCETERVSGTPVRFNNK